MIVKRVIWVVVGVVVLHWAGFGLYLKLHRQTDGSKDNAGCIFNESGRDYELLKMIEGARRNVLLKTGRLEVGPVWDALAKAGARGVKVEVFCPNSQGVQRDRIIQVAAAHGTVILDPRPEWNWNGTLLYADGEVLYSAADLSYAVPGAQRAYVRGKGRTDGNY